MGELRTLSIPRMSRRAFLTCMGTCAGVCLAAGIGLRRSQTRYNDDGEAFMGLSFLVHPATENIVTLYSDKEVEEAMGTEGVNDPLFTIDELRTLIAMSSDDVTDLAPVVLTARFDGCRTYVYEAFRCTLTVTGASADGSVAVGDSIEVYDPFMIRQPGNYSASGGIFGEERTVSMNGDCPNSGWTPMRGGQEYLLFLVPKAFPWGLEAPGNGNVFTLAAHPYARVPVDVSDNPQRVQVLSYEDLDTIESNGSVEYIMPDYTFGQASEFDLFVQTEKAAELYLLTCEKIVETMLGPLEA